MARLIEIDARELPPRITLRTGDVLKVWTSGARVDSGADTVELLGPFLPGVIALDGAVLSPQAAPNAILLLARQPGKATIAIRTGDPWRQSEAVTLDVVVEG